MHVMHVIGGVFFIVVYLMKCLFASVFRTDEMKSLELVLKIFAQKLHKN